MNRNSLPYNPEYGADKTAITWPATGQIVLHSPETAGNTSLDEWLNHGWQLVHGTPPYVGMPPA